MVLLVQPARSTRVSQKKDTDEQGSRMSHMKVREQKTWTNKAAERRSNRVTKRRRTVSEERREVVCSAGHTLVVRHLAVEGAAVLGQLAVALPVATVALPRRQRRHHRRRGWALPLPGVAHGVGLDPDGEL